MNLLPSPDQAEIAETIRVFLSERAPVARFRPPSPQIGNNDESLWPQLAELGFLGIAIAEAQGGIGLTVADEMLAYREFGRHLVSPAVLGITLAAHLAAACHEGTLLAELLGGGATVGLANPRGAVQMGPVCSGDFHLIDAQNSAWILCSSEHGTALLARDQFTDVQAVLGTDNVLLLQRASLKSVQAHLWLGVEQGGPGAALFQRALLLVAAYAVGMAEATRDMAVEYAKVREQFGKPIGSFQAVKHICADMAIRAEAAFCQTSFAALTVAEGHAGGDFHVSAAKVVACKAALENAAQNIQVHGAFGFTSEGDAHLFLKRAHVIDQLCGDQRRQRQRLLDMPFPEAA